MQILEEWFAVYSGRSIITNREDNLTHTFFTTCDPF